MNLADLEQDAFSPPYDFSTEATLSETIDIVNGGGFMNDPRWRTSPATGYTKFRTASNLTAIGPGPVTSVSLDWPKLVVQDSVSIADQTTTSLV